MLDSNIKVGEHGHMFNFCLLLFFDLGTELFPIAFNIVETGFDGFDGLLMEGEAGEDDALVDVGGGDGLVGVFVVFVEERLLDLETDFQGF
jgi:hypothetical protein